MKSSLKFTSFILLGLMICLGIGWIYLKSKASSQPQAKPVPTTFFNDGTANLVCVTSAEIDQIGKLPKDAVIWIDIQMSRDKEILISSEREFLNSKYDPKSRDLAPEIQMQKLSARYMNWTDLQILGVKKLKDVFTQNQQRRWIINVFDYSPGMDQVLSAVVSDARMSEKIILQSEQDGALTDLRKLQPMWLYGTSRAQIVQTIWLSKLGLERLAPLKGDVLITPLRASSANQNALLINEELLNEARRRSMKVLIGPADHTQLEEIRSFNVDGIVWSNLHEFSFSQL